MFRNFLGGIKMYSFEKNRLPHVVFGSGSAAGNFRIRKCLEIF